MSIKATPITMGQSTRASLAAGTGYYRYNGDKPLRKDAPPAGPLPQNKKAIAGRAARLKEYERLRLEEGLTRAQAAERLGVCLSTSHLYEREFQEQQRGTAP